MKKISISLYHNNKITYTSKPEHFNEEILEAYEKICKTLAEGDVEHFKMVASESKIHFFSKEIIKQSVVTLIIE